MSGAKVEALSKFVIESVFTCWIVEMQCMSTGYSAPVISYDTYVTNVMGKLGANKKEPYTPP